MRRRLPVHCAPGVRHKTAQHQRKRGKDMKIGKITLLTVALAAGTSLAVAADKGEKGQLASKDYKFAVEAAQGGMAEVQLGELAKTKATNPQVKSFADKMVTDHNKANDELKQIVSRKGATLPTELPRKENSTLDSLQKATGADFDKQYVEHMVKDHKKDVKDFQDASQSLNDPDLKAFAQKTLPTLQDHLRMIEQIEPQVSNKRLTTTGR
jgi:putative membrane protein